MTWKALKLAFVVSTAIVVMTGCRGNPIWDKMRGVNNNTTTNYAGQAPGLGGDFGGIESSVLPEPIRGQSSQESPDLKRIYFSFDSASLLEPAKEQLDLNAAWLRGNPNAAVQIEGHCDERGTADYNYALGQRRAESTRNYLVSQGIDPGRLHTISYGSERPGDPSQSEMSWARNRRVQFMVYNGHQY